MKNTIIVRGAACLVAFAATAASAAQPADTRAADTRAAAGVYEGRSVAEACEPGVEVCAIMSPDRLVSYPDRCVARDAGAQRILVGPCFDAD